MQRTICNGYTTEDCGYCRLPSGLGVLQGLTCFFLQTDSAKLAARRKEEQALSCIHSYLSGCNVQRYLQVGVCFLASGPTLQQLPHYGEVASGTGNMQGCVSITGLPRMCE